MLSPEEIHKTLLDHERRLKALEMNRAHEATAGLLSETWERLEGLRAKLEPGAWYPMRDWLAELRRGDDWIACFTAEDMRPSELIRAPDTALYVASLHNAFPALHEEALRLAQECARLRAELDALRGDRR